MPVTIITGTRNQGDISFAPRTASETDTPGTAEANMECQFRSIGVVFERDLLAPIVTLCTTATAFADRDVGAATGTVTLNGYMATGTLSADPLYLITRQYAGAMIATFGTGNTLTMNVKATRDELGFNARDNSSRSATLAIVNTPTSAWTTTST